MGAWLSWLSGMYNTIRLHKSWKEHMRYMLQKVDGHVYSE